MNPTTFEPLTPKVVLGVAAHPDDLDFGAAGTMAAYAAAGADVHYLLLTDGSKGSSDVHMSSSDLIKIREDEQRAAVEAIGGKSVQFLGYPDGGLEVTLDLKKEIVKVIRTLKPDVVVTMDPTVLYVPERGFINHPDHRAAGQATLDAVFPLARDHLTYPDLYSEGYEPHKVAHVLLINMQQQNFYVDISHTFDKKIAALKAHDSQIADLETTSGWMRQLAEMTGAKAGTTMAESFMRIDTMP